MSASRWTRTAVLLAGLFSVEGARGQDDPAAADAAPLDTIPVDPFPDADGPVREAPTEARGGIAEIVVTAQKIEQSVKDVPISITVLDDKLIAEKGIVDVREAMLFVPNVKVESAGFFAAPRARGFSFNNNNKAIEPPLGVAFDGIPYTNPTYFNAAVFDIARVEVLRGPQGTTFGKNTTAGVIHLISQDPSDSFRGVLDLQAGEFDRRRIELAVGGPLITDSVLFRLALVSSEREGFIENTTALTRPVPDEFRGYSQQGLRAKLLFPDLLGGSLKLTYEGVELEQDGAGEELSRTTQPFRDVILAYDPNADFEGNNYVASIDGDDFRYATVRTGIVEWKQALADWNITALGGYSVLDQTLAVDTDFTPVPALHGRGGDRNPTTTFELRGETSDFAGFYGLQNLFGLDLGSSDLLLGAFFQKRDILDSLLAFELFNLPFLQLTAAATGAAIPIPLPPDGSIDEYKQFFEQTGDVRAVFGQSQWHFLPHWTLQTGLRLSREKKRGVWDQVFTSPPPNAVALATGLREFSAVRRIEEDQVQPKISLNWNPVDEISLFLHWARAFKGGGFNAFAFDGSDEELLYDPETVEEWGFDVKSAPLFDGKLRFNVSLYRMDAEDFQVLGRIRRPATIGLGVTSVENAPKARAQGVEGDVTWAPLRGFTVIATLGFNDTEYLDFKTNECPADRTNEDGDDIDRCDATGKSFPFAPKWDSTLSASWIAPLSRGLTFQVGSTVEYQSSQLLDLDLDERKRQPGFARLRANIGIGHPGQGWTFQIIGNNLTDKATSIRMGDVFEGQFVNIQEPPREIFGQFRYQF